MPQIVPAREHLYKRNRNQNSGNTKVEDEQMGNKMAKASPSSIGTFHIVLKVPV